MSTNHAAEISKKENLPSANTSRSNHFLGTFPEKLKVGKKPKPTPDQTANTDLSLVTNKNFIKSIFSTLPEGALPAVCSKKGDPKIGSWPAMRADTASLPDTNNNYISCSSYYPCDDDSVNVRKEQFAAYHFLMLDDLNTKVPMERLGDFKLSFLIETSPGNFQGGIILDAPITNIEEAERIQKALIAAGLCDKGAGGLGRYSRLPQAINGKEEHKDAEGKPFRCRLEELRPDKRYSPEEIIDRLELKLEPKKKAVVHHVTQDAITPQVDENKVVAALKARGLYKKSLGSGKHDITCPWVDEHTDKLDDLGR